MMREALKPKRGSALLIVLGMFSFMLVSAVSFSIYMRASRAPSSYVRRNSVARHLAHAALARAMDEIDCAIGNDPFPGVGYNHNYGGTGWNDANSDKNDNWHGHVFTPSNEVAAASTVSTLTLEALGYLPPCLINEVRYWSRHSRTAQWHSFNYGIGQFAFTAVNVSDFFEINQFRNEGNGARKPYLNRNSAPHGRISPTYLFRSPKERYDEGTMDDVDDTSCFAFLSAVSDGTGLNVDPKIEDIPFVSMMDFNLALGGNIFGKVLSPFYRRINGNSATSGRFYEMPEVRPQVFMAGGWNGDSNLSYSQYDAKSKVSDPLGRINLRYPEFQPFSGYSWFPEKTSLSLCVNNVAATHPFWQPMNDNFPVLSTALLCDYLDYDSVPLSLCIPCTEAVPMICGVELNPRCITCKPEYVMGTPVASTSGGVTTQTREDLCRLNISGDFNPTITVVYPFGNSHLENLNFEVECYARIFFEEEQNTGDSVLKDSGLRSPFFNLGSLNKNWSSLKTDAGGSSYIEVKCSGSLDINRVSRNIDSALQNGNIHNAESEAVVSIPLRQKIPDVTKELARLTFEDPGTGTFTFRSASDSKQIDFYPLGKLNSSDRVNFSTTFANTAGTPTYRPMVAIWVRIKDKDDKTVDMVPAVPKYDKANDFDNESLGSKFMVATTGEAGEGTFPALRFFPEKSSQGIVPDRRPGMYCDTAPPTFTVEPEWKQKSYIANDPRINWAPEQWWATSDSGDPKNIWLNNVRMFCNISSRDSDIFMSVSDQGYLQSMYEWMMIPQVRSLSTSSSAEWGVFEGGSGYDGVVREGVNNLSPADLLHNDIMWRTYRSDAFNYDSSFGSIDNLPFDDAENGLRVNPYTDITNVMFGAFANMPRDWWAASTNYYADGKAYMNPSSKTFEKRYLFDWSCEAKDVYSMAKFWMYAFRGRNVQDLYKSTGIPDRWLERFDGRVDGELKIEKDYHDRDRRVYDGGTRFFNWRTGESLLPTPDNVGSEVQDIMQNDLTLVDRKFMYGYLKGCFANTSQLFLLFVRAESAAGGGGAGSGSRAVALVWRDPAAPSNGGLPITGVGKDNGSKYLHTNSGIAEEAWRMNERKYPPHKMRVLFYHQLD